MNGKIYTSEFPVCCMLSADIITSYLKSSIGSDFKYICTDWSRVNHAWTQYDNGTEKYVIDFCEGQFHKCYSSYEKIIGGGLKNSDDVVKFINSYSVIMPIEQSMYFDLYSLVHPKESEFYSDHNHNSVGFSKKNFMLYCQQVCDEIYTYTEYY